jgi:hypothetical protein
MSNYSPDRWVVLEVTREKDFYRRLFAGWYGGFAEGDSWKLNSGITQIRVQDDLYEVDGASGSTYFCNANGYGLSGYMGGLLAGWRANAPEVDIQILNFADISAN